MEARDRGNYSEGGLRRGDQVRPWLGSLRSKVYEGGILQQFSTALLIFLGISFQGKIHWCSKIMNMADQFTKDMGYIQIHF